MSNENLADTSRVIVIPVDSSVHTERAIDWYVENMMRPTDIVHMVNVVEPIYRTSSVGIAMEAALMTITEDLETKIKKQIDDGKLLVKKYIRELRRKGGKGKGYIRIDSKIGEAILKVCHEHNADLIVLANRGEGLIRRTFLGTVSDYVLKHAGRPVVIVPFI